MEEVDAGAAAQETLAAKVARVHHGLMSTQVRLVVVVEAGLPPTHDLRPPQHHTLWWVAAKATPRGGQSLEPRAARRATVRLALRELRAPAPRAARHARRSAPAGSLAPVAAAASLAR